MTLQLLALIADSGLYDWNELCLLFDSFESLVDSFHFVLDSAEPIEDTIKLAADVFEEYGYVVVLHTI